MLKSSVKNWVDKCNQWKLYCKEHEENIVINPILVIQVEDGNNREITQTDLGVCIEVFEEVIGRNLIDGEVVHTFNDQKTLNIRDIKIQQIEASRINEEENVKIVFFKMNLSTGWDCPRAETMMSFRRAEDYTYIAQLLGRVIRTPLARRVATNAELNNVSLYLPSFNENTVKDAVKALNENEAISPTEAGTENNLITLKRSLEFSDE
mgnify:FL=1